MTDLHPSPVESELQELVVSFVKLIAQGVDYPRYVATLHAQHDRKPAWLREHLPWQIVLATAHMAWQSTPHPEQGYALLHLPRPGRNASCPCGSGRKYKQCCVVLEQDMPGDEVNLLPQLLDVLPRRRWRELTGSRIPPEMVAQVACGFLDEGRAEDACKLLEPWFEADRDFHARRENLLDLLLDACDMASHPRKKARLLARAAAVGDKRMRSTAMQRKASIVADKGDFGQAWELFGEAQRIDPESISLSHLEVTLLLNEQREAEARERARFWAHRFEARRDPGLTEVIAFLRGIAEDGEQAMQRFVLDQLPEVKALEAALHAAPPAKAMYTLDPAQGQAGPMQPKPSLRKAFNAWESLVSPVALAPLQRGDATQDIGIEDWLPLLNKYPVLWNAFEVLAAIVEQMHEYDQSSLDDVIVRPVLERAVALLHLVIAASHAGNMPLEWGWVENRPALYLLGVSIAIDMDKPMDDERLARLEWLVRTLNPNDNQGYRFVLMRGYLALERVDDALELARKYPDDMAEMQYNHALALHADGQSGKALKVLGAAVDDAPKLLTWMLKTHPKPPATDAMPGIRVGSDQEAWLYRSDNLALWQQYDALGWLRGCAKALQRS